MAGKHVAGIAALVLASACGGGTVAEGGTGGSAASDSSSTGGAQSGGTGGSECLEGMEACPCYRNGTCDDGLTCLSSVCVFLPGTGGGAGAVGTGGTTGGSSSDGGTGATGGAGTTGGGSTTGGASATGGAVATGGTGGVVSDCETVPETTLLDFEDYDGTSALADYEFSVGGSETLFAGLHEVYGDADVSLTMEAGYDSTYAITLADTLAEDWGGGFEFWVGEECANASGFTGITFWARGIAPQGIARLVLMTVDTTPVDEGGTCVDDCYAPACDFAVTDTWTEISIPWASGWINSNTAMTVTVTGDNLTGFSFNMAVLYEDDGSGTWVPVPAEIELQIDDLAFY